MDPVTCGLHESLAILASSARYSRPLARESHRSARRESPGDEAETERQPSHASSSEPTFLLKNGRNQLSVSSSVSSVWGLISPRQRGRVTVSLPLHPAPCFPSLPFRYLLPALPDSVAVCKQRPSVYALFSASLVWRGQQYEWDMIEATPSPPHQPASSSSLAARPPPLYPTAPTMLATSHPYKIVFGRESSSSRWYRDEMNFRQIFSIHFSSNRFACFASPVPALPRQSPAQTSLLCPAPP